MKEIKEIKVLYKEYKSENKYKGLKKKKNSYNEVEKTIVLLIDEYDEKAIEYLEKTKVNRSIVDVADVIKYHMNYGSEKKIKNMIEDIKEQYEDSLSRKEMYNGERQQLNNSINLLSYILDNHWFNQ